jgi:hypothetical protein
MPCGVIGCGGDVVGRYRVDGKGQLALCESHARDQVMLDV